MRFLVFGCRLTVLVGGFPGCALAADLDDVITATYGDVSISAPTPASVIVCHDYGCRGRTEVALTASDRAKIAQILSLGRGSAEAERKAVANAVAWFDKRVGPLAGTANHMARAGIDQSFHAEGQFDCIDSSRNTTSVLLILAELKLLRYHSVDVPFARGHMVDFRPPHVTAVLEERAGGKRWAIDSWTKGYGQLPDVMPLDRWEGED